MSIPVLILGASGTGKTYSLRNIPHDQYGLIECEKNMLPFRGGKKFARTKDFDTLRTYIATYADKVPIVVVDDFGYAVTDLFMKHISDRDGYAVYKQIASEVYNTIEFINDIEGDVIVYITMHTDNDAFNNIIPKIMGKMVNEKIDLVGMMNVVLLCDIVEGEHSFIVNGKPPAKSCGAFEQDVMPNDLAVIDAGLREFLGWTEDAEDDGGEG